MSRIIFGNYFNPLPTVFEPRAILKDWDAFHNPSPRYFLLVLAGTHTGRSGPNGEEGRVYSRGSVVVDKVRLDLHFVNKFKNINPAWLTPLGHCPELLTEEIMGQSDWIDVAADWLEDHEDYAAAETLRRLKG